MIDSYAEALGLTLVVELVIIWGLTRKAGNPDILAVAFFANLFTHPLASFAVQGPDALLGFWPTECAVIVAEALLFRVAAGLSAKEAIRLAAIANGATIVISLGIGAS